MNRTIPCLLLASFATMSTAAYAGYSVSSFDSRDTRKGKNYYNAGSALDTNMETCWRVDPEQKNEGSWMQIDVPASTIDKIAVVIGWAKDEATFKDYARIKKAKVQILDGKDGQDLKVVAEQTLEFKDTMEFQILELPDTKVGGEILGGGAVKLIVEEVYDGADFPALAVSELRVHLKEFPAESLMIDGVPSSELDNHMGFDMVDANPKTFWAGTSDTATMAFTAGGYGLASLGMQSGPKDFARAKTVKLIANDAEIVHTLEDKPGEMQWLMLPALVGFTGGAWGTVKVEITESYPAEKAGNGLAISEVKLNAATIEDF